MNALPYHAGLDAGVRRRTQERFLREDGVVVVATIAFGMGIDKPDVRFVAHVDLPKSVEGYYQETGRAGRDGAPATAWLAYGLQDVVQQRRMIDESPGDLAHRRRLAQHLDAMLALCETVQCRRQNLLGYFGEPSEPCGNCDTCLEPPAAWDGTVPAQKLMSTIVRLQRERRQRFGAGHLIDILRGKETPRVRQYGHDSLATWGIGADLTEQQWRGVVRQLLAQGLLATHGEYGTLTVTDAARPRCSRAARPGDAPHASPSGRRARAARGPRRPPPTSSPAQAELFERCARGGPPRPASRACPPTSCSATRPCAAWRRRGRPALGELDGITGIGAKKLEAYGERAARGRRRARRDRAARRTARHRAAR